MKTSAFLGTAALVFGLLSGTARADDVPISDNARSHFKTGVAYLQDPDGARYEEAYREFKTAFADSASWKILGNLGITALKLERDGEAIDAFEKYLAGGGTQIDPAERSQMERDLMTTKAGVVYVSAKVDPPGASLVDEREPLTGRPVTNTYDLAQDGTLRIGIRRGKHRLTARLDGYVDQTWDYDAEPGPAEQLHAYKLEVPKAAVAAPGMVGSTPGGTAPEMTRPITTPIIIGAAATGALLIGSGVVGILAVSKKSQYNSKNDGAPANLADAKSLRSSGETLNLVSTVLLGGAVVSAVVTTVLFVGRPSVASQDTGTTARRFDVTPAIGTNSGGLVMSGAF